jgi:hypothetical protein
MIKLRDILKENLDKNSSFDYGKFLFAGLNTDEADPAKLKKFLKKWYTKDEINTKDEEEFLRDLRSYTTDNKAGNLPKICKMLKPLKSKFPGILDPVKTKNKKTNLVYRGTLISVSSISKYDPKITKEYVEYNNLVVLKFNKKFMSFSVSADVAYEFATNHGTYEERIGELLEKGLIPAIISVPITDENLLFNPDFVSIFSGYDDIEEETFYLNDIVSTSKILIPNEIIYTIKDNIDKIPDKYKLEYNKILKYEKILKNKIIPNHSSETQKEKYLIDAQKKIQQYIKNGSKGTLDLFNTPITSLPDNLTVNGELNLSSTKITSLPDNLTVTDSLYLNNTPITSLPNNLTVGDGLYLRNTPITSLPDNLTVGGNLYLNYTPITSLPDNLTVNGGLSLAYTPIESLPDNLTVGGTLDLSNTKITSFPNNLTIGGDLYLNYTPISKKYTEVQLKKMLPGVKGDILV